MTIRGQNKGLAENQVKNFLTISGMGRAGLNLRFILRRSCMCLFFSFCGKTTTSIET